MERAGACFEPDFRHLQTKGLGEPLCCDGAMAPLTAPGAFEAAEHGDAAIGEADEVVADPHGIQGRQGFPCREAPVFVQRHGVEPWPAGASFRYIRKPARKRRGVPRLMPTRIWSSASGANHEAVLIGNRTLRTMVIRRHQASRGRGPVRWCS